MITTQALIDKFRQALQEGWGYIWGTAGETWTAEKQKELEKTTDKDRAQGREYGSKWIGKKVADCSGLFSWAFKQLGGYMYHGSDTMYRKYCADKGELKKGKRTDCAALKPGTAVFVWNGSKYSHVGLFVGDNTVIEAMGTINGVTTSKVTAGKWIHWGELSGVDYRNAGNVIASEAEGSPSVKPTLRKGSKGNTVRELQTMLLKLGYDLGPCGIDGDFGKATEAAVKSFQSDYRLEADGVVGALTWSELRNSEFIIHHSELGNGASSGVILNGAEGEVEGSLTKYSVTISGLDLTQARALQANYPGSEIRKGTE